MTKRQRRASQLRRIPLFGPFDRKLHAHGGRVLKAKVEEGFKRMFDLDWIWRDVVRELEWVDP